MISWSIIQGRNLVLFCVSASPIRSHLPLERAVAAESAFGIAATQNIVGINLPRRTGVVFKSYEKWCNKHCIINLPGSVVLLLATT